MVMACRNINRKSHIGLQQISSLTETGRSFLGPVKSSKFIIGEGSQESVLTCSIVRLLENLDLTCSAGQLLYETVQSQKNVYGTGTNTLLFLAGAWSVAALECLQQDIPISVIVSVMSEGLKSCREEVVSLQIPLCNIFDSIRDTKYPFLGTLTIIPSPLVQIPLEVPWIQRDHDKKDVSSQSSTLTFSSGSSSGLSSKLSYFTTQSLTKKNEAMSQSPKTNIITNSHTRKSRLSHSRHFNRAEHDAYQSSNEGFPNSHFDYKCNDLVQLAVGLSHGDHSSMALVEAAVKCQYQNAHVRNSCRVPFQFDVSKISTCCLPGISESISCVCSGYLTLVSISYKTTIRELQNKPLRVVLIDGDFKENYHHLGFNEPENVKTVLGDTAYQYQKKLWLENVLEILIQLNVNLVMVRGTVSENLIEKCMLSNLLIIGHVSHHALQDFAEVTGAVQVVYATQLNEGCVGSGAYVSLWRPGQLNAIEQSNKIVVLLKAKGILLVTAVLASPVIAQMQAKEDIFWTCAYRLYHALLEKKVFLGGGAVEVLCLSHLQMMIEQSLKKTDKDCSGWFPATSSWMASSQALYRPAVLKALADGWHKYLSSVVFNTGTCSSESEASTFIQNYLQKITNSGCPLLFLLKEYDKLSSKILNVGIPSRLKVTSKVYDVVTPKFEAWRRALDLVLLVLQTDAEIIIGARNTQLNSQESDEFLLL
ncbi:Bardet-Biedl syndrome 12 protein [Monodelphis domestica]|uniref:Bardet-Biedl syndrome 12 protein n=1 Tax=Monodelphis domestica TaxID=13616 RepID=UPI0024E214DF|nr:Bardet-Biedl syndrome 12 protein [Monodelphis domestica]XP_007495587.2 Bardet-Biedl syndrome 12 protein [Monodelphis domestica]XP_007495588.2 Bardet-Biedl syndrome 12 protein [Monodelphis domestica]